MMSYILFMSYRIMFQCQKCPEMQRREEDIKIHVLAKHFIPQEVPYLCKLCQARKLSYGAAKTHKKLKHPSESMSVKEMFAGNHTKEKMSLWLVSSSAFYTVSGAGSASAVVLDSASASPRSLAASDRPALRQKGWYPRRDPTTHLAALAAERILDRKSASCCVMTTLHLGRDDRGKENVVSPP